MSCITFILKFRINIDEILFSKQEATSFISQFANFSEDSIKKIRTITMDVPLFISFLKKFEDYFLTENSEEEIKIKIEKLE